MAKQFHERYLNTPERDLKSILRHELGDISDKFYLIPAVLDFQNHNPNASSMKKVYLLNLEEIATPFNEIFHNITSNLEIITSKELRAYSYKLCRRIFDALDPGTKYRNVKKLAPITIYFALNIKCIEVNSAQYIEAANLTREDFRVGVRSLMNYCPEFLSRDRELLTLNFVNQVASHFNLDSEFTETAHLLLKKLWPLIRSTKEAIIAAVISTLALIKLNIPIPNVATICKNLGIQPSTVLYQVKHKILEKMNITGFQGLRNSKQLLEPIFQDL